MYLGRGTSAGDADGVGGEAQRGPGRAPSPAVALALALPLLQFRRQTTNKKKVTHTATHRQNEAAAIIINTHIYTRLLVVYLSCVRMISYHIYLIDKQTIFALTTNNNSEV